MTSIQLCNAKKFPYASTLGFVSVGGHISSVSLQCAMQRNKRVILIEVHKPGKESQDS